MINNLICEMTIFFLSFEIYFNRISISKHFNRNKSQSNKCKVHREYNKNKNTKLH